MELKATLPVKRDDANSFPPDIDVTFDYEGDVVINLRDPYREITINRKEFDTLVQLMKVTAND